MQGTPNAERLMKTVRKYFKIDMENHNRAYVVCLDMKVVYANEAEENKVLFEKMKQAGFKPHNQE